MGRDVSEEGAHGVPAIPDNSCHCAPQCWNQDTLTHKQMEEKQTNTKTLSSCEQVLKPKQRPKLYLYYLSKY